jgi:hypothetical protein
VTVTSGKRERRGRSRAKLAILPALGVCKTKKRKMESAEHGIGRRRKNVSTAEIRVVDIEI